MSRCGAISAVPRRDWYPESVPRYDRTVQPSPTLDACAEERDRLLRVIVAGLRADDRFVAAWLGGSLGRDSGDAVSDLDLNVVVADAANTVLCATPAPRAYGTTPERRVLFARFGQPALVYESHNNAPPGGSFSTVIYASSQVVDWVLIPRAMAERPPGTRVLFDTAGVPIQEPPEASAVVDHAARVVERIGFFWLMLSVTAKYIIRRDAVYVNILLDGQQRVLEEVRAAITGSAEPYRGGSRSTLAPGTADQVAALRLLRDQMLALLPEVAALGGAVPEPPLQALDALLALAEV